MPSWPLALSPAAPPWWLSYLLGVAGVLVAFAFWMLALDDAVRRPEWQYPRILPFPGQRTAWILVVLLGSIVGSAAYYATVMRPYPRRR